VDVYFMHIQGSGLLCLEDGSHLSITYDGTNGYPYRSLREIMIEYGLIDPNVADMESLKEALRNHPLKCQGLLSCNPSYVFFKILKDVHPQSRLGAPLVPERSLAVDPLFTPFGSLLWLDCEPYQRLMLAQDLGVAIKGPIRGDIFCGTGEKAAEKAGALKAEGSLYRILKK
jgi:membrane-bound lytic murein transglycosylase A